MALTFGRFPTYNEVKEYYTRDDILEFVNDAAAVRSVVLSFKEEPSIHNEGESPPFGSANIDELRQHIMEEFARMLPEHVYPCEKPLQAYPSLHFLTKGEEGEPWDFIMEADCPGWRRSFVDVRGAIEILHAYNVPFIAKFSGHRSLHLIIPREAFPSEFRDRPIGKVWKELDDGLRKFFSGHAFVRQAHGTGGLLRMSYSLNENTGIVSLPIPYEELDTFRPWESFHHLVRIKEEFKLSRLVQKCKERTDNTAGFLNAALNDKSISPLPRRMWSFSLPEKLRYAELDVAEPADDAESAWRDLATGGKTDDEAVRRYRYEENPDIRWFIAESLIGDERSFELLPENDEYALCAIEDSIARQANSSMSSFFDRYQELSGYHSVRGLQAIMERLEPEALKQELLRRSEVSDEGELRQLVRFASIVASVFRDWDISEKVIQQAMERFPGILDEMDQGVLEAAKGLEARNITEIREAQRVLFGAGKKAAEQLLLTMASDKPWVRRRAIEVISKLKDPAFIECLVNALGDESRRVRSMAIPTLVSLGDAAKTQLEEAANSDNPMLRANAIRTLGYIEGDDSFGVAVSGLESTNVKVRNAAIKSLGRMGDERAREALRSALWDIAPRIGVNAAYTLGEFGPEGVNILKDALAQAEAEGATQAARCIAHGLADAGNDSGLDHVISALYDESWEEWGTPFRIAELKHPRGNEAIISFFRDNLMEREVPEWNSRMQPAVRALGEVEDERVVPLLQKFLERESDKKALKAGVDALRIRATTLREREAIRALVQASQADNRSLAQRAASALAKIGQEALPEVEKALMEMEQGSKAWKLLDGVFRQMTRV
jgi:HEAT repeat protein